MSLLTNPDDWMSTQGSGIVGSTANINHSLGLDNASKALQGQAFLRATQFRNDAAKEMAENRMPPSAGVQQQSPGWMGLANTALRGGMSIFNAIQAGSPGTGNFDTSGPMWTGAQQEFNDFYNAGSGISDAASSAGFGVGLASGADFGGAWDGSIW
jgi:hypothetical protein